MELSIVVPTYNEKENIQILLEKIGNEFRKNKIKGEVIVVDDNSADGTGQILEKLKKRHSFLRIIHREGKLGLSSAVIAGFKIARGDVLGVMDADLSHPPEKIPEMFKLIKDNDADFAIGSRYIKGGEIKGWGIYRKMLSRGATLLARVFTDVKDPMTGFFMIKKECVKNKKLNPKGFKILLELIIKANYKKIKEVPITFTNRKKGKSKAGTKEIIYYISNLASYLPYKKKVIEEFFKFALVGLIGTAINIVILYYFTEFLNMYYLASATLAFLVAVTSNFILNKIWTFKEKIHHEAAVKYSKFFIVSIVALVFNLFFLYILTEFFQIYYIVSQIIAIGLALIINFLGNKIWTFNSR